MADPRQGDVWWASLPHPFGRHPVVVLTRTGAIPRLTRITIAPLTRTIHMIQSEVVLSPEDGVATVCAVSVDNIQTIGKGLLDKRMTRLDAGTMSEVFTAIRFAFDMPAG